MFSIIGVILIFHFKKSCKMKIQCCSSFFFYRQNIFIYNKILLFWFECDSNNSCNTSTTTNNSDSTNSCSCNYRKEEITKLGRLFNTHSFVFSFSSENHTSSPKTQICLKIFFSLNLRPTQHIPDSFTAISFSFHYTFN